MRGGRVRGTGLPLAVGVILVGIVVALGLLVQAVRSTPPSVPGDTAPPVFGTPGLDIAAAQRDAQQACALLGSALQQIAVNGGAQRILTLLTEGRNLATEASFADPIWVHLASASQELHDGVVDNDAALAARGARDVPTYCATFQGLQPTP